MACTDVGSTDV